MRIWKFLWKDADSATGDCPAIYETDDGLYYAVQGLRVSAEEKTGQARNLADGEDVVLVPKNVLDRLAGRA